MNKISCQYESPWFIAYNLEKGDSLDDSTESKAKLIEWLFELHRCRIALKSITREIDDAKVEPPIV